MEKIKKFTYDFFVLVFPVMLGVYLGLLANNWNEARTENRLTQKVMDNLLQEIEYNQHVVATNLPYFIQLRDSIYALPKHKEITPSSFSFWQGLNPPLFKSSSFESASITGILPKLDIELIETLTTTYNLQMDLKNQTDTYLFSITNKIGTQEFDNSKYLIILENYAHDQISSEQLLIEQLEQTKNLLISSKK